MRYTILSISAAALVLSAPSAWARQMPRDTPPPPPAPYDRPYNGAGAPYAGRAGPDARYAPPPPPYRGEYPRFDAIARDAWLADCHDRVAWSNGGYDSGPGPGECEAYLDQYYAAYTGAGYASGQIQPAPQCTETVEYVTEYVPVTTRRRVIAPRRSKPVPDKRVKLTPIK